MPKPAELITLLNSLVTEYRAMQERKSTQTLAGSMIGSAFFKRTMEASYNMVSSIPWNAVAKLEQLITELTVMDQTKPIDKSALFAQIKNTYPGVWQFICENGFSNENTAMREKYDRRDDVLELASLCIVSLFVDANDAEAVHRKVLERKYAFVARDTARQDVDQQFQKAISDVYLKVSSELINHFPSFNELDEPKSTDNKESNAKTASLLDAQLQEAINSEQPEAMSNLLRSIIAETDDGTNRMSCSMDLTSSVAASVVASTVYASTSMKANVPPAATQVNPDLSEKLAQAGQRERDLNDEIARLRLQIEEKDKRLAQNVATAHAQAVRNANTSLETDNARLKQENQQLSHEKSQLQHTADEHKKGEKVLFNLESDTLNALKEAVRLIFLIIRHLKEYDDSLQLLNSPTVKRPPKFGLYILCNKLLPHYLTLIGIYPRDEQSLTVSQVKTITTFTENARAEFQRNQGGDMRQFNNVLFNAKHSPGKQLNDNAHKTFVEKASQYENATKAENAFSRALLSAAEFFEKGKLRDLLSDIPVIPATVLELCVQHALKKLELTVHERDTDAMKAEKRKVSKMIMDTLEQYGQPASAQHSNVSAHERSGSSKRL